MLLGTRLAAVVLVLGGIVMAGLNPDRTPVPTHTGYPVMHDTLTAYITERLGEQDQIEKSRLAELDRLAAYIRERQEADESVRLNFICTHNSRRSHISQIWAQTAAEWFGIESVETYSGGTEATAFNPSAVAAIRRAGFEVLKPESASTADEANPRYRVRWHTDAEPMICFSKKYDHPANPQRAFGAVMVCTDADEKCPVVVGAEYRQPIPYVDPKAHDGKPTEAEAYDERCRQIAREMLYVFAHVRG